MTKCSDCGYKIEGDVYLIKNITSMDAHFTTFRKGVHIRTNKKFKICGLCYLRYEENADSTGYSDHSLDIHIHNSKCIGHTCHDTAVQLLGKSKR